jgi:protein phosphatase PTC2/3
MTVDTMKLRAHCESWPGLRKTLQDRFTIGESMDECGVFFGVYDGHGGPAVATPLAKDLHRRVLQQYKAHKMQPGSTEEKLRTAIRTAHLALDHDILDQCERKKATLSTQGSTSVSAILQGNPKAKVPLRLEFIIFIEFSFRLVVANVGDSRALLFRDGSCLQLTTDHTPYKEEERRRVEKTGGQVRFLFMLILFRFLKSEVSFVFVLLVIQD